MSRYDKYDPESGGFRAPLNADFTTTADFEKVFGVSLNASGKVVLGTGGQSGYMGVMVLTKKKLAGDIVDIMTDGEIVEFPGAAGTIYYVNAGTGLLETSAPAAGTNKAKAGATVEASRLVVRASIFQG